MPCGKMNPLFTDALLQEDCESTLHQLTHLTGIAELIAYFPKARYVLDPFVVILLNRFHERERITFKNWVDNQVDLTITIEMIKRLRDRNSRAAVTKARITCQDQNRFYFPYRVSSLYQPLSGKNSPSDYANCTLFDRSLKTAILTSASKWSGDHFRTRNELNPLVVSRPRVIYCFHTENCCKKRNAA